MNVAPPFRSIVCVLDGGPAGEEAARQAERLAGPSSELTFVSTLEAASGADLLVVGAGDRAGSPGGVIIGSLASAAIHTSPLPVLLARAGSDADDFPRRILVATDGSPDSRGAVEAGAAIARDRRSEVTLLRVEDGRSAARRPLADDAELARAIGPEPATTERFGDPSAEIVAAAGSLGASLLVVGSRGLGRARTLGSVGERVAHEALCSVLVVRAPAS
jgi:nucleotide-binding universal stress UspA family protein